MLKPDVPREILERKLAHRDRLHVFHSLDPNVERPARDAMPALVDKGKR
ncbi:MAG TPA: hypothetical protein VLF42_08990 [Burkholderiales bacterium]|nr:hypothetical protein [Burkholderiales bacterium]